MPASVAALVALLGLLLIYWALVRFGIFVAPDAAP